MAGTAFSGKKPRAKRTAHGNVIPLCGVPTCPDWLDKEGAALYAQLSGELNALGLLSHLDSQSLAHYCQAVSDYIRCTRKIRALNAQQDGAGDLHSQGDSYQNVHPLHTLRNQAEKRADVLGKQFGFTPLARRALQDLIKPADSGDAIEEKFFAA